MSTSAQSSNRSRRIVLGSSSPRRKGFVEQLFPRDEILIEAPADDRERDLTPLTERSEIEAGVLEIAAAKATQVASQLGEQPYDALITADTAVVVPFGENRWHVLGKPEPDRFPQQVRGWFRELLLGRSHQVLTGVCVCTGAGEIQSQIVATDVEFSEADEQELEWYLATGESLGKAGGYAIQGLGSCFVRQLRGSLSNVVGLPLRETRELVENLTAGR